MFTSPDRRHALLLPFPSSPSKNLSKLFYQSISGHIFTKKPNFITEVAFLPRDNLYHKEIDALHSKKLGLHNKLKLIKIHNSPNKFANSLPKFVVLPVNFSLYKRNQIHGIFKTWTLQNAFKQLIREQVFDFQSHPVTRVLVRKIEEFYVEWNEGWGAAEYEEVAKKVSKRAIKDERSQISFWVVDYKGFDFLKCLEEAEGVFKM